MCIRDSTYTDPQSRGGYGPVTIKHRDGTVKTIDFDAIEGQLML